MLDSASEKTDSQSKGVEMDDSTIQDLVLALARADGELEKAAKAVKDAKEHEQIVAAERSELEREVLSNCNVEVERAFVVNAVEPPVVVMVRFADEDNGLMVEVIGYEVV